MRGSVGTFSVRERYPPGRLRGTDIGVLNPRKNSHRRLELWSQHRNAGRIRAYVCLVDARVLERRAHRLELVMLLRNARRDTVAEIVRLSCGAVDDPVARPPSRAGYTTTIGIVAFTDSAATHPHQQSRLA